MGGCASSRILDPEEDSLDVLLRQKEPMSYASGPGTDFSTAPRRRMGVKDLLTRPFATVTSGAGDDGADAAEHKEQAPDISSLWDMFSYACDRFPDSQCLCTRAYDDEEQKTRTDYVSLSYCDVKHDARAIAAGLLHTCKLARGDRVGIYANNRAEWTTTLLANLSSGIVTVPLYATLGPDAVAYILEHSEQRVAFCSKENLAPLLDALKLGSQSFLKFIVQFDTDSRYNNVCDGLEDADVDAARSKGVTLLSLSALKTGAPLANAAIGAPTTRDELAYVMYTSGTTGTPKGVMLSNGNVLAAIAAAYHDFFTIVPGDRHISYLPLAHIMESAIEFCMLGGGGSIWYYQGDIKKLSDDIQAVRPTLFGAVPRVYERIYQKVMAIVQGASWIRRKVFFRAFNAQVDRLRAGNDHFKGNASDRRVLSKIRKKLGFDACRVMVTGSAPMPDHLKEFFRVVVAGGKLLHGYGLTETSAALTGTAASDLLLGHVGAPVACMEVRLEDVPAMGYFHTDTPHPRGEICVRGPAVFIGYLKNAEKTKEDLSSDGWLHTGDVGRWNPNGTLSIIGRKKELFKLSQGEYVAPDFVESVFNKCEAVSQIFVYGNSYKPVLIAVVVPDVETVLSLAAESRWPNAPSSAKDVMQSVEGRKAFAALVNDHESDIASTILKKLCELASDAKLQKFKIPAGLILEGDLDANLMGWNPDNNCLTPTFKLKRPQLGERYMKRIKELYEALGMPVLPTEKIW